MKKYLTCAIAALFATTVVAFASPEAEMLQTKEKAAWQAFKEKKSDDYKKLLAQDFQSVYPDGIYSLDKQIDLMSKIDLKSFALSDFVITMPDADTAVVTYKAKAEATLGGKDISGDRNAVSVWHKKDGEWQCAMNANTMAEPIMPAEGPASSAIEKADDKPVIEKKADEEPAADKK